MKRQEFIDKLKEIGTCDDDVQRRTMLADLETEVSKDYDNLETLTTTNATLTEDNEKLRKANMDLFLHMGKPSGENNNHNGNNNNVNTDKKRTFSNLFDEKGELK